MKPLTDIERWLINAIRVVTHSTVVTPPEGREAAARDAQRWLFVPDTAMDQLRRAVANYLNEPSVILHVLEVVDAAFRGVAPEHLTASQNQALAKVEQALAAARRAEP